MYKVKTVFQLEIVGTSILLCLLCSVTALCQPDLPLLVKSAVYRAVVHRDSSTFEATGLMMRHNEINYLILNEHTITDSSGVLVDSVRLFLNQKLSNGDVMSGPENIMIYTRRDDKHFLFRADKLNSDICLLLVSTLNSTIRPTDSISFVRHAAIANCTTIEAIKKEASIVTLVGFPGKAVVLPSRTQEYLWGDLLEISETEVLTNAPALAGSSGSPMISRFHGKYFLIGVVRAVRHDGPNRLTVGVPLCRIEEQFSNFFTRLKN